MELPKEINLTAQEDFRAPDELADVINEYLCEKFGVCPEMYSYEIKLHDIVFDLNE